MFAQLPMYQNKGKLAYKADLSNIIKLSKHLGNPERKFKSIHVAGTNGKGSTSHMLASVLQEAGYKVGLYTSPHLKDFKERIKLNGVDVTDDFVVDFVVNNKSFFEQNMLSFFEMTVGMAFSFFAKKNVDFAIIEVGLGGRLDSTNIIMPELSIITNIGLDHTKILGNTRQLIATEKAGIIKQNTPVIIGETHAETSAIFNKIAQKYNSTIYFADQLVDTIYETDLKGNYQKNNTITVVQAINVLNTLGYNVANSHLIKGLLNVVNNTNLKGRWQLINDKPKIICDTAHNKEGLTFTMKQLKAQPFKNLHLVLGFVNDKNLEDIIHLFPEFANFYFCSPKISRGLDAKIVMQKFKDENRYGEVYVSVNEALKAAKHNAKIDDVIYVGGSTFVVAEIF